MENYDVNPLVINDMLDQFSDTDIKLDHIAFNKRRYAQKLRPYSRWVSETIQKGVLWVMFFYIPVYGVLLYFNVTNFISLFSLCYLFSYIVVILLFIAVNRENDTFK
jgi:hypothetical protein